MDSVPPPIAIRNLSPTSDSNPHTSGHSAGVDSDELPKHERDHGWFVGYAPAEEPRIAFAVIVEHGGHGGSTAAPIVREALRAFFFPGDRLVEEQDGDDPSLDG